MTSVKDLAKTTTTWGLDDFVTKVNELLPHYLPEDSGNARVRGDINPRLVRHYTSLGMLDEPLKEGREARYEYRHLLQILVVRGLLTEGYGASAIAELPKTKRNDELEAMLEGGIQLTVAPANPALAYLEKIKDRVQGAAHPVPAPAIPTQPNSPRPEAKRYGSRWTRYEVLPGLEFHVSDDFNLPKSLKEQQNLLQFINQKLLQIQQRRGK